MLKTEKQIQIMNWQNIKPGIFGLEYPMEIEYVLAKIILLPACAFSSGSGLSGWRAQLPQKCQN